MHEEIICAGFGGQGIMLMGKLLAASGMREGYNVTWLPSYGAEVRGGTAHSMVHIATEEIASPTVSTATTCIVMNKPSLTKFMGKIKKDGILIVNISMVDKIIERKAVRLIGIPLTQLAVDLGNVKVANMIAVGALIKLRKIFSLKNAVEELGNVLSAKKEAISLNKKALKLGYDYVGK